MDVSRFLRRISSLAFVAVALAVAPAIAGAQATTNDHLADAFWLGTGDLDASVTNNNLTVDDAENLRCPSFPNRLFGTTGWWWYHGSGRPVTISTAGSTFDTILGVYTQDSTAANQVTCDDRDPNESVTFPSQLDEAYYVQVGTCVQLKNGECGTPFFGAVHLLATTPAPVNDSRASAAQLTTGVASTGDTVGSTEEPGEVVTCTSPSVSYGRTTWYTWHAPGAGTATFSVSGVLYSVVSAYKANATTQLGCAASDPAPATARLQVPVEAGDYYVQVAGLGKHDPATLLDSDQGSTTVKAEFAAAPPPAPVAPPKPAPPASLSPHSTTPVVATNMNPTTYLVYARSGYTIMRLVAAHVPAGTRIEVRCSGGGCPFRSKLITARRTVSRMAVGGRALRRAHLRKGAVVQVRIAKPGFLGRVTTFRIRAGRLPVRSQQCLVDGSSKRVSCSA